MLTYPPLLSLKADRFVERVLANSVALGLGVKEFAAIAMRKADALTASPLSLGKKREALSRLCEACGEGQNVGTVLGSHPAAVSYSVKYIDRRCRLALMLSIKLKPSSLLALSNAQVEKRLSILEGGVAPGWRTRTARLSALYV